MAERKKEKKSQAERERELDRRIPNWRWRCVHNKKLVYTVYFILRAVVIVTMILQFFNENYENVMYCILVLVLYMLPSMFERRLHIDLPDALEIIILLFIFAAEILGEIAAFYLQFQYWDTVLHTLNGFLCAAIGFSLVDLLNREERVYLHLSPFFMAVVAFCFSMTIGVIWEFFEFACDTVLLSDSQKDTVITAISTVELDPTRSNTAVIVQGIQDTILVLEDGSQLSLGMGGYLDIGLIDTMEDLFVNFIGATVFSVIGYFWVKNRKGDAPDENRGFAGQLIPRKMREPAWPPAEDPAAADMPADALPSEEAQSAAGPAQKD